MTQRAKVVLVGDRLMAQTVRSEACAQCRACAHGQTERQLIPLPEDGCFREGDEVDVSIPEGSVGKASLLCYGVPFACFAAGLALGTALAGRLDLSQDLSGAAGALLFTAAGWLIVRRVDRRMRRSECMRLTIRPAAPAQEKEHQKIT